MIPNVNCGTASAIAAKAPLLQAAIFVMAERARVAVSIAKQPQPETGNTDKIHVKGDFLNTISGPECSPDAATQTTQTSSTMAGAASSYVSDGAISFCSLPTWVRVLRHGTRLNASTITAIMNPTTAYGAPDAIKPTIDGMRNGRSATHLSPQVCF